jgi:hypothetical protein
MAKDGKIVYVTYVKGSTTPCISLPLLPSRKNLSEVLWWLI